MSHSQITQLVMNTSAIMQRLASLGVEIKLGSDFTEYNAYRRMDQNRSAVYPMFDPSCTYIDEDNGAWMCGFDENGQIIHTQAAMLHNLKAKSLAHHLNAHRQTYITPDTTPDPYTVLGVTPETPIDEIRSVWRRMVRETHPDKMMARGVPEEAIKLAEKRLVDINRAWEQISEGT